MRRLTDLPERIQEKIMPADDGCWLWTGALDGRGYGRTKQNGDMKQAHRFVYELLVGPITAQTLDHLCRVRSCVNPAHLEPVSNRENLLRGNTIAAINAAKTRCKRGHPFDEANTYVYPKGGRRDCRRCRREGKRARSLRVDGGGA